MWTHNAGNKNELASIEAIVDDFNASQTKYKVEVQAFPQDSYNQSVVAAAAAKKLPCILDIDGPNVPNWAWAGYLAPLEGMDDVLSKYLPSTVGKYKDKTTPTVITTSRLPWSAAKSVLKKYGIRVPTVDEPWTRDEFMAGLKKIKDSRRLRLPAGHRDQLHRRVVAVRVLAAPAELRRRPDQPQRLQVRRGRAERWQGARVGYLVPRPGDRQANAVEVRRRSGKDFINGKTAMLVQRHVGTRSDAPQEVRRRHRVPAAARLRHRPEDRRRVLAVGHVHQLR